MVSYRKILWAVVLVGVVAAIGLLMRRPKYEAEVVLQIHPVHSWIRDESFGPNYPRMQMELVRSRVPLQTALKDPKVAALVKGRSDPVGWVDGRLKVDFPQGPEFMRVSMRGDDELELTVLLDAIVNAYLDVAFDRPQNQRLARIDRHFEDIAANRPPVRAGPLDDRLERLRKLQSARRERPINDRDVNFDAIMNQIQQTEGVDHEALAALRLEVERSSPRVQRVGNGVTIRKLRY